MDQIERIERASEFARQKIAMVRPGDLTKATPCTEFDVRALLDHVLGGLSMMTAAALEQPPDTAGGSQFGEDPSGVYEERSAALLQALRTPGALGRDWQLPFGAMSGETMAQVIFMEQLIHAWDLAKATGQETTMPDELVLECSAVMLPMDQMLRTPGVCGPAISLGESASAQDKLIAFFGRQP